MNSIESERPDMFIKFVLVIVGIFLALAGWSRLLF